MAAMRAAALRVGGRAGYGGCAITLPHDIDLELATEQKSSWKSCSVMTARGDWRSRSTTMIGSPCPKAAGIPAPQWDYQHHIYPAVALPLSQLKTGAGANQVRLQVSDQHPWNWPQNLIYGIHIRVYYDAEYKPHPHGSPDVSLRPAPAFGATVRLAVDANGPNAAIQRVDYLGHYEDANFEGDGQYSQWHYHYVKAELWVPWGWPPRPPGK